MADFRRCFSTQTKPTLDTLTRMTPSLATLVPGEPLLPRLAALVLAVGAIPTLLAPPQNEIERLAVNLSDLAQIILRFGQGAAAEHLVVRGSGCGTAEEPWLWGALRELALKLDLVPAIWDRQGNSLFAVDLAEEGLKLDCADKQNGVSVVGERLRVIEVEEVPRLHLEELVGLEIGLDFGCVLLADVQLLWGLSALRLLQM